MHFTCPPDISSNRLGADGGSALGSLLSHVAPSSFSNSATNSAGAGFTVHGHMPPLQTCVCACNHFGAEGATNLAAQVMAFLPRPHSLAADSSARRRSKRDWHGLPASRPGQDASHDCRGRRLTRCVLVCAGSFALHLLPSLPVPLTSPPHAHMCTRALAARTHAQTQMCGNRKLEKLDVSSNAITDDGMRALSPALAQLALLADLNLASNHISLSGMVHLFSAFLPIEEYGAERADTGWAKDGDDGTPRSLGLERLDVSDNCFGDLGALCAAFALSGQSSLQSLALSHCQVLSVSIPCSLPFSLHLLLQPPCSCALSLRCCPFVYVFHLLILLPSD